MTKVYDEKQRAQSAVWLRYVHELVTGKTNIISFPEWQRKNKEA
jgi:glycerol-3-phosphate cytidylyltransferase-like family protein